MRIFKLSIERTGGDGCENWRSTKVAANTCSQAIQKVSKSLESYERVLEVELLASTDDDA
jgi:hypothetical protein